jgi:DNA-binding MarR family transcriptional regulator
MNNPLIAFVNTFDISLKKYQAESGASAGISKLTISQFQYIDAIHTLGSPTITEIADKLRITKASVTAGINKLCNLGYVLKTRSSEDKRVFHVSLTEPAGELVKAKYQAIKEYAEFINTALTREEARQFESSLIKIVAQFNQQK